MHPPPRRGGPAFDAARRFEQHFGRPPEAVVFAPGRVNLIGEHLDYCGLPVLPSALSRGIALAFRRRGDPRIRCLSTEPGHQGEAAVVPDAPPPTAGFGRYLAAAASGLRTGGWVPGESPGFDGFLASDLPVASGLSSSSALVVAAALALLAAAGRLPPVGTGIPPGIGIPPPGARRLALDLAAAERGAAIQGGAMDQSVCLGAAAGYALGIAFEPPEWHLVPVDPSRFSFLVAYSGEPADKGGAAGRVYDRRVREARKALALARRALGEPERKDGGSPGGYRHGYPGLVARHSLPDLLAAARRLPDPLGGRFRHLVTEAERVAEARRCLRRGDAEAFGALLDRSHESLRRDYQVSTPKLDALVAEARHAGALGARLTGAGLGGSVVILVPPAAEHPLRRGLRERFYAPRGISDPDERHLLDGAASGAATILEGPDQRGREAAGTRSASST